MENPPAEAPKNGPPLTKGIAPTLLLDQVLNTAPWIFDLPQTLPYIKILDQAAKTISQGVEFDHFSYFRLCLAAHHATVGTFVPTDVDNHIRLKLWTGRISNEVFEEMARLVIESLKWDNRPVSTRRVKSPSSGEEFSGHEGEWFSTAVAAYATMRGRNSDLAHLIVEMIVDEMKRQAQVYADLRRARDGVGLLKAATLIAHNLGDLDRVIDIWKLPEDDFLRKEAFKVGHQHADDRSLSQNIDWKKTLAHAGALNKSYMAAENHRHFALRGPRCLRRSAALILPLGPFFDEWGSLVARSPQLMPEDIAVVTEALIEGWERLPGTIGYTRALAGILDGFRGGYNVLSKHLPARVARHLKSGALRTLVDMPRKRFEDQWAQWALKGPNLKP